MTDFIREWRMLLTMILSVLLGIFWLAWFSIPVWLLVVAELVRRNIQ